MKYLFLFLFILGVVACKNEPQPSIEFYGAEMNKLMADRETLNTFYQKALVYEGNATRIAKAMQKAKQGQSVTIGAIGGSITAGANAETESDRWINIVWEWWQKKFPDSDISLVNAGIGATNSVYGVHRADKDLLYANPDFVIIEFSVNDAGAKYNDESYEGLIRKILNSGNTPGVLCLSILTRDGKNAQEVHLPVCEHYKVPMISQRDALKDLYYDRGTDGKSFCDEESTWCDYSNDDVHPSNWGHAVAAAIIVQYLEFVYNNLDDYSFSTEKLPQPITINGFENSKILDNSNCTPVSIGGWENFWKAWKATSSTKPLAFDISAGYITVNYKRTNVAGKGGMCRVKINNKEVAVLSADFSGGWGDYIAYEMILKNEEATTNRLSFHFEGEEGSEFIIENIMIANY